MLCFYWCIKVYIFSDDSPYETLPKILDEIRDRIDKRLVDTHLITDAVIKDVLTCIYSNDEDIELNSFELIDAYLTPKLEVSIANYRYHLYQLNQTIAAFSTTMHRRHTE